MINLIVTIFGGILVIGGLYFMFLGFQTPPNPLYFFMGLIATVFGFILAIFFGSRIELKRGGKEAAGMKELKRPVIPPATKKTAEKAAPKAVKEKPGKVITPPKAKAIKPKAKPAEEPKAVPKIKPKPSAIKPKEKPKKAPIEPKKAPIEPKKAPMEPKKAPIGAKAPSEDKKGAVPPFGTRPTPKKVTKEKPQPKKVDKSSIIKPKEAKKVEGTPAIKPRKKRPEEMPGKVKEEEKPARPVPKSVLETADKERLKELKSRKGKDDEFVKNRLDRLKENYIQNAKDIENIIDERLDSFKGTLDKLKSETSEPSIIWSFEAQDVQGAMTDIIDKAENKILMMYPWVRNVELSILKKFMDTESRMIIQEASLDDDASVELIRLLQEKDVKIRTMPHVHTVAVVADDSNGLIISTDPIYESYEVGVIYKDSKSIQEIERLFDDAWEISKDVDLGIEE